MVAHARCNNDKRAALAGLDHLERWWSRVTPGGVWSRRLAEVAYRTDWPRQPERTAAGARGLYLHQPAGTMLWVAPGRVEPLELDRLHAMMNSAALAAEPPGAYED